MVRPVDTSGKHPRQVQEAQTDPIEINKSREAPGHHLTFGLEDLKLGNHLSPIQINEREFLSLSRDNPQELFNKLFNQQNGMIQQSQKEQQSLEDKISNLKQRIHDQTATMRELIDKRDAAQDIVSRIESGTPAPRVKYPKSTKLPDRQVLVDRKDPKFESWLINIKEKLKANTNHYPTAQAQIAYIKSICKEEAANHLLAHIRKDSPNHYKDIGNIFKHLQTLYQDANRVINTKIELRRLIIKNTKFQSFLSQFVLLTQDTGLAASE
jgi:hypothetical protein